MKKLVISGSSKLYERGLYWRGYFEGRGYDVIDWPRPLFEHEDLMAETQPEPGLPLGKLITPGDLTYSDGMIKFYRQFYKHLDQTDVLFIMNEDKNGIEGYIGANTFSEITYAIMNNLNRGRKVEINLLKLPSKKLGCYEEIKFWLDQDQLHIYRRPTGKKATLSIDELDAKKSPATTFSVNNVIISTEVNTITAKPVTKSLTEGEVIDSSPSKPSLFNRDNRMLDITTCNKRCLRSLTPEARAYLKILSPEFPAWLLKYIAAPEMQRLSGVSMVSLDYSSIFNFEYFNDVFTHSIGVALIIWHFTHDKKQTLAGLFHDIASPAFKHCIDYMNGDSERQESIEARTSEIIRSSRIITKNLKRDNILVSEISDYHLYPIADNDAPNLAADRLEYTFSNNLFLFNTWNLDQVQTFYENLTILKNEQDLDELGFINQDICENFTTIALTTFNYHSDKHRANLQFIADIIKSMINGGYLTIDDLYVMSEREVIDWILGCGDKTIAEAFRNFQHATTIYAGATIKKNCYCVSVKSKVRYINPLFQSTNKNGQTSAKRIAKFSDNVSKGIDSVLSDKQSKYVGFDFDFKPYTE